MKVAICFSGAIRSFDDCICSIFKYFLNNFEDADIFLHMWTFNDKDNLNESDNIKYNFKWRKDNSSVDKILSILKPKKYVIEEYTNLSENLIREKSCIDMDKFDTEQKRNYGFNCCSMYWKILKSFELAEEFGKENCINYDLVIRARLDFIWEDYIKPSDFVNLSDNSIFLIKDRYATCSKLVTNDKFFAGNYNTMKKMCNLFNNLKNYQDEEIMIEGQTVNEIHIKKMNFNVNWIGHANTYYKFMDRHKIQFNKLSVLLDLDNLNFIKSDLLNELIYVLLNSGFKVNCKSECECIENYNNINNRFNESELKHNIIIKNDKDCIIIKKNNQQKKLTFSHELVEIIKLNSNFICDFIQSLILKFNIISTEEFQLDKYEQINKILPKEIIVYKYMDRGYYYCEYIGYENNNHIILFDKKNIKVQRDTFKILNIAKYYNEGILPIN